MINLDEYILSEKEKVVLKLWCAGWHLTEIAKKYNVSRYIISNIKKQAINRIKKYENL